MMMFLFCYRNDAPVRHFANYVLELNCRVVNPEVVVQALFHLSLAEGGMSAMDIWHDSALVWEPMLHTCRS